MEVEENSSNTSAQELVECAKDARLTAEYTSIVYHWGAFLPRISATLYPKLQSKTPRAKSEPEILHFPNTKPKRKAYSSTSDLGPRMSKVEA